MVSLKELCASTGKSIAQIERELKFGHGYMYNTITQERKHMKIETMNKVSKYFNVPIEEIEQFKLSHENYLKDKSKYQTKNKPTKEKIVEKVENYKPLKCLNEACPLNKGCRCDNPIVLSGKGPCYGKDKVKAPIDKNTKDKFKQIHISPSWRKANA